MATGALTLKVPPGGNDALTRWLDQHSREYYSRAWFGIVSEAVKAGDWDRAWAFARVVEYNPEYVVATTPEEMAIALGQRARPSVGAVTREGSAVGTAPTSVGSGIRFHRFGVS